MHLLRVALAVALAALAMAAPTHRERKAAIAPRGTLPAGCPDYCDCSKYKDDPEGLFQCATNPTCEYLNCH